MTNIFRDGMAKLTNHFMHSQTQCCHSDKYSVVDDKAVCTNTACNNYLAPALLQNNFSFSFHPQKLDYCELEV